MPAKLSKADLVAKATSLIKAKPTFALVGVRKLPERGAKNFKIKCLDCGAVELRDMRWLASSHGCMCSRGSKIAKTQRMSKTDYTEKWRLSERKLKIVSEFCGMHVRVDVRCLRCSYVWSAAPTNLRKAGCPKCAPRLQQANNLKTYGVEHTFQREDVQRKRAASMKRRYGEEHALQSPKLFQKMVSSSYKTKEYALGGRSVLVQGYEPLALDWLLANTKISASDIRCGSDPEMPRIEYVDTDGRRKIYHPDFFVPKHNLIVEVKSSYTYSNRLQKNLHKAAACSAAGYKFRFLVMHPNGSRIHV